MRAKLTYHDGAHGGLPACPEEILFRALDLICAKKEVPADLVQRIINRLEEAENALAAAIALSPDADMLQYGGPERAFDEKIQIWRASKGLTHA